MSYHILSSFKIAISIRGMKNVLMLRVSTKTACNYELTYSNYVTKYFYYPIYFFVSDLT